MQSLELQNDFLKVTEKNYCMVIDKYNMTDRMVEESMESIRQWYRMQPHLPSGALSDDRLFRHLLAVGFSLEKAKTKIDNMMTAFTIMPELMQNRDPGADWAQHTREYTRVAFLPQLYRADTTRILVIERKQPRRRALELRTPGAGPKVDGSGSIDDTPLYVQSGDDKPLFTDKNPVNFSMADLLKMFILLCDYRLCADITLGEHYIIDFGTVKLSHMVTMTPSLIKKSLFLLQSCFGAKIKGIHYVNVPPFAEYVVTLVKAGMSKKLASRIHVYKDHKSLHKVFPKSMLPKEMGGEEKSMDEFADATVAELSKPRWRQWFKEQDKFKTEESKRRGAKSDISNELLGMQGSFRTLDID